MTNSLLICIKRIKRLLYNGLQKKILHIQIKSHVKEDKGPSYKVLEITLLKI